MGLCKRCYAELQTALEEQRLLCNACFKQARRQEEVAEPRPEEQERPFCCASDPPCPSCPYVIGE